MITFLEKSLEIGAFPEKQLELATFVEKSLQIYSKCLL
jgi:hypothetical protein